MDVRGLNEITKRTKTEPRARRIVRGQRERRRGLKKTGKGVWEETASLRGRRKTRSK